MLDSATAEGSSLVINGTLSSTPNTAFLLEFFSNPTTDPTGHEQGDDFLGNLSVTTDALGNAVFSTSFPDAFPADVNLSTTATDPSPTGDTSEFSNEEPITPQPTGTLLSSSVNPSMPGQAVTFTATVEYGYQPTGTVSFYDGSTLLGTATLVNGEATLTTSTLSAGTHSITAIYGGDADNDGSTSSALSETID